MKSALRDLFLLAVGAVVAGCSRSEKAAAPAAAAGTGYVTDAAEIRVEYKPVSIPTRLAPGSQVEIRFEAKNVGSAVWPSSGEFPLHFGYHWQASEAGGRWETISWDDSNRSGLPSDVRPGETVVITLPVRAISRTCVGCRLVVVPLLEMKAWSETAELPVPIDVS
jgi:hypothetical protein